MVDIAKHIDRNVDANGRTWRKGRARASDRGYGQNWRTRNLPLLGEDEVTAIELRQRACGPDQYRPVAARRSLRSNIIRLNLLRSTHSLT